MKFSRLQEGNRTVPVGYQGHQIAIEYDAKRWGGEAYRDQARSARLKDDDPQRLEINKKLLHRMLTAWDLTDEDCPEACQRIKDETDDLICREHALPVTVEAIAALPPLLRTRMVSAIFEDVNSDGSDPKLNGSS